LRVPNYIKFGEDTGISQTVHKYVVGFPYVALYDLRGDLRPNFTNTNYQIISG